MPKYSYVIPVYNSEKYLNTCIESLLVQTYEDFEIILVDDGSADSSPGMCDGWTIKDPRIRAIHKENGGASSARNAGLLAAAGDYIIFVDSDDYWAEKEGLAKIDQVIEKDTDIVAFASLTYYEDRDELVPDRYFYLEEMNHLGAKDCLRYMITKDLFNVHPGKKVFRKSFLTDHSLYFKTGIRAEDIELFIRVSDCLPCYKFLPDRIYVYRQHEGSVTRTAGGKHLSEHLGIVEEYKEYSFADDEVRELLLSYLAYSLSIVLAHAACLKPENKRELMERGKKCSGLFRYTAYPRTRRIALLYRLAGFRLTVFVLGKYLGRRL